MSGNNVFGNISFYLGKTVETPGISFTYNCGKAVCGWVVGVGAVGVGWECVHVGDVVCSQALGSSGSFL